jgi:allantoinase
VLDDEPVILKTTHKPVVALPYNFELHDIVMMALQHHPSEMMYRRMIDAFNCLYEESAERAKIMAIACHPYLSGQPHRIAYVERAYAEILQRPGVACWDGEKILDWYLATQKIAA